MEGGKLRVMLYAKSACVNDEAIEAQIKKLRAYARDNSFEVLGEYIDNGPSKQGLVLPAFKAMMTALDTLDEVHAIIVTSLSRLSRNRGESILYRNFLSKKGVDLISVDEPFEDSPASLFIRSILEMTEGFYPERLTERIRQAKKANALRGFFNGGRPPYGYKTEKVKVTGGTKSRLIVDPGTSDIVRRIFSMFVEGNSPTSIAIALNNSDEDGSSDRVWTSRSVRRTLTNSVYVGDHDYGRVQRKGGSRKSYPDSEILRISKVHPAIIDGEMFGKVQGILHESNVGETRDDDS